MAPLAGDRLSLTFRRRLEELTARTPGRAEFALRLAVISALATLVAQIFETPEIALSAYVVFFMMKPDRTGSVLASITLTVIVSIIIAFLLLAASLMLDQPPLRLILMAGLSLSMLFLASASKLKPIASTIALIVVYALDVLGRLPSGELATRVLLYTWLIIAVPAGVSVIVNLLAGPSPRRLAERAIAMRLRAARDFLQSGDETSRQHLSRFRFEGAQATLQWLRLASLEKTSASADLIALRQAARSTETLLMVSEAIGVQSGIPADWRQSAARALGDMAAILERGRYPVRIEPIAAMGPKLGPNLSLMADFDDLLSSFAVAEPVPGNAIVPVEKPAARGFFLPDAFTNPDHVRFAVKVTIAAMACYLFYSVADWPGIHTCLITCYIVALDTTAETIEKLSLRIGGALVGGAVGFAALIWLTPHFDRIGGLLSLIFAGALAGGWIAGGGPRIAYAGFQLAFAFFLTVDQGWSPAFDLTVARDRIIGILIGNAAIYLVFVSIWPVSIVRRIDTAIASLCRSLSRIARLPHHAARRDALPEIHPALASIAANLDVASFEPTSMRPPLQWFRTRGALLEKIAALETDFLISDDRAALVRSKELDELADRVLRGKLPGSTAGDQRRTSALA